MNISIKKVENGIVLTHKGKQFVFDNGGFGREELSNFIMDEVAQDAVPSKPSTYNLVMTSYVEGKQIPVIRSIRELTGMGLKESKDLADYVRDSGAAFIIKNVSKERAQEAQKFFSQIPDAGIVTNIEKN